MPQPLDPDEILAVAQLLDDPSDDVRYAVDLRVRSWTVEVLDVIDSVLAETADPQLAAALEELYLRQHEHFARIAWHEVLGARPVNLERGVLALAYFAQPRLRVAAWQARLDAMAETLKPRVAGREGVERAVSLFEGFGALGYGGAQSDYYDPQHSYLNWVIEHKRGLPITLSVLFTLIGWRLSVPVFGVNMPAHFICKYEDGRTEAFFDLFYGSGPLSRDEVAQRLVSRGLLPDASYFLSATPDQILRRMVRNLVRAAEQRGDAEAAQRWQSLARPWERP
ncbi:MAG: transglutaminase-like domain-containing protein [Bacteroidota bacterium]